MPSYEKVLARQPHARDEFLKKYQDRIASLSGSRRKFVRLSFEEFVTQTIEEERDRQRTIEGKAHSLLGQTGITISLLLGSLSVGATQLSGWPLGVKLVAWGLFLIAALQFVVSGLHARAALILLRGYARDDVEQFLDPKLTKGRLLSQRLFQAEHNSFLNDAKATFLKFAHWYFKSGIMWLLFASLILPPLVFLLGPQKSTTDSSGAETRIFAQPPAIGVPDTSLRGIQESTDDSLSMKELHLIR
jgi:hypothetical protein